MNDQTAKAIVDCFVSHEGHSGYSNNMADAIYALARAIDRLGTNDAATSMGAIELLAMEVKEGLGSMAQAIDTVGSQIENVAQELRGIGQEIGWGLDPDDSRRNHL